MSSDCAAAAGAGDHIYSLRDRRTSMARTRAGRSPFDGFSMKVA